MTILLPLPALAADNAASHASTATFLVQIALLVLIGRLCGEAMQRLGQPAVMGSLIGGILLGKSVLGALWPSAEDMIFPDFAEQKSMINGLSQFGILVLLLLAGMETDLGLMRKLRRAALSVSIAGIAVPFACGFAAGELLPAAMLPHPEQRLVAALFLGTALSISSVKIVAMVVREMNFMRRDTGQIILAAAMIDDTLGWIIIAVTLGLASSAGLSLMSVGKSVVGTALFLAVSLTIGRRIVFTIIRWANDRFVSEVPVITAVLVIMVAMALLTDSIGVDTVLGAFVAGILVGESPILTRQIDEQLRGVTTALFLPVFFGLSGMNADLTVLKDPVLLATTAGLILIASLGKSGGAFTGAWIGGLGRREAFALAVGMNARGSTEVIVASIGLSMGVLSQNLFTMIVVMALITTMAMPPTLRWALARLPMNPEEKRRLEHEVFEDTGFVANLERLLLGVDDSPNGKFASRIAGLLAAAHGMPVTAFRKREPKSGKPKSDKNGDPDRPATTESIVKTGVETSKTANQEREGDNPSPPVEVVTVHTEALTEQHVADEAKKGYDLLIIGLQPGGKSKGGFDQGVNRAARGFAGPLGIVRASGIHREDPVEGALDILVPITGAVASRRAAEVAFAIARATNSPLTALYVESGTDAKARRRISAPRHEENAVLAEMAKVARHYGVALKTSVRTDIAPANAILLETQRGGHTLIVMGVNRRPGNALSFGNVAEAVLEGAGKSLLLERFAI